MTRATIVLLIMQSPEGDPEDFNTNLESYGAKLLRKIGIDYYLHLENPLKAVYFAHHQRKKNPSLRFALGKETIEMVGQSIQGDLVASLTETLSQIIDGSIAVHKSVLATIRSAGYDLTPLDEERGDFFLVESPSTNRNSISLDPNLDSIGAHATDTSPKESVFDFSRVEQERLQESSEIQANLNVNGMSSDETIPLASSNQEAQDPRHPPGGPRVEVRSKSVPIHRLSKRKKPYRKYALISFAIFVIGIPTLTIGAWWGIWASTEASKVRETQELDQELQSSEVLQSLKSRKERIQEKKETETLLEQQRAQILIKSSPSGAAVFVDGVRLGDLTPVRISNLPVKRSIKIQVKKPGFEESLQFLNLEPDEEKTLHLKLTPLHP